MSAVTTDDGKCTGGYCKGTNDAASPHGCPYQEEINESTDDSYCTCCDDCRYECAMDI